MNENSSIQESVEGYDSSKTSVGWGEYPLDSVFVRTEKRTVNEVIKRINAGRYEMSPDFQRDFVWPIDKQSRLIESCLMRIPLPVFYVAEAKDGRIIVVDGLQRLTTFRRFLGDKFPLTGLGKEKENDPEQPPNPLNGKKFSDLPLNLQERVEDTQLTLYILDPKAPERAKMDIFERVNGGVPLSRQQMRNCLHNGLATRWLKEMAESAEFLKATGNTLDKKSMRDREAINRFCAFKILGKDHYKGDMDAFLAETLENMNQKTKDDLVFLKNSFTISMKINYFLFEKHAFRKSLRFKDRFASRTIINIALFDVCSFLFSEINESKVQKKKEKIVDGFKFLIDTNSEFERSITYATNSTKQVLTRFVLAETVVKEALK